MLSKIASNTQRMVNTVGPASIRAPSTAICRSLPPGVAARSSTVTSNPADTSSNAATSPPIPAPMTTIFPLRPAISPPACGNIQFVIDADVKLP